MFRYRTIIALPEKMSGEKVDTMKALGAEIVRTPTEAAWDAPDSHLTLSWQLANTSPDAHCLDQYANAGNALSHFDGTAEEILEQTGGDVDFVFLSAGACCTHECACKLSLGQPIVVDLWLGTGGTASGVARKIKQVRPSCKIVAIDPQGSILAEPDNLNDQDRFKPYAVEGIGYDFVPTVLDRELVDEWVKTEDQVGAGLSSTRARARPA